MDFNNIYNQISIPNLMMDDLVNFGFRNFKNGHLELPVNKEEYSKLLEIVKENILPVFSFKSENSINEIQFYLCQINSVDKLTFDCLRLKSNYYILADGKYNFH